MGSSPSPTFTRWLNETVNTERTTKTGNNMAPAAHLTGVLVMQIMPLSQDLRLMFNIKAGRQAWVTYAHHTTDISRGDNIITNPGEANEFTYPVQQVRPYPGDKQFIEIIMYKK